MMQLLAVIICCFETGKCIALQGQSHGRQAKAILGVVYWFKVVQLHAVHETEANLQESCLIF